MPLGALLQGYEAANQSGQRDLASQLQQVQGAMALRNALTQQARQQAYQSEIAGATTPEQKLAIAQRYMDPNKLGESIQAAQTKEEQMKATALTAQARLDQQKQYNDMMHQWRMANAKTDAERLAETERHNKAVETINQQNATLQAELRRMGLQITQQGQQLQLDRQRDAQDQRKQQNVQQLGTALDRANLPESDAVLRGVEDALTKTPELASYLAGPGSLMPDIAVPEAIREGRQAFQKLFNITLKNRSGAAVTIPEFERLKAEFATGAFKTPAQLRAGVEQARNIISQHYKGVVAGFSPETMETYNANLRTTGGTPLLEPRQSGPKIIKSDAEYDALPSGAIFVGPDGKTRKKP